MAAERKIIDVNTLNSQNAKYLQAKREFCELNHWCGSILIIIIVFCIIGFVIAGFLIIKPAVSALSYIPTECTVEEAVSYGYITCQCGGFSNDSPYCTSKYHCISIKVSYPLLDKNGNQLEIPLNNTDNRIINGRAIGILYENELQTMSLNDRCSFAICKADARANTLEVDWFRSQYGESGHRYDCLYNPFNYTQVIAERNYKTIHIFHAVFWPITLVVICSISWYVLKKCKEDFDEMNGNDTKEKIDNLNAIPQSGKVNKFGQMDYNRDGWPVWPSLVEGYNKQILSLTKPGDPANKIKNSKLHPRRPIRTQPGKTGRSVVNGTNMEQGQGQVPQQGQINPGFVNPGQQYATSYMQ